MVSTIDRRVADVTQSRLPALALSDVTMEYTNAVGEPLRVVSSLSFTLEPGRMVCLAGRSGSGKTTVISIAAGLLRPTAGTIRWGELNLADLADDDVTRERGRRIGVVFQNAALIASLRAGENVALAGMVEPATTGVAERVAELMDSVGLPERGHHFPAELSGGEQQRVALARALYREPPLLLADEPTASLDRATADDIVALLVALRDDGQAVLVATHDETLVAAADLTIRMD